MNGFAQVADMQRRLRSLEAVKSGVPARAAGGLTAQLRAAHAAGVRPDGTPYGANEDGSTRRLARSGALGSSLSVKPTSGGLRAVVGVPYGLFYAAQVLPVGELPPSWTEELQAAARAEFEARVGGRL